MRQGRNVNKPPVAPKNTNLRTISRRQSRAYLLACFLCVLLAPSAAQAQVLVIKQAATVFSNPAGSQIAVVRADRALQDHQRVGFFRIGLLPLFVVEHVQIEILKPKEFTRSMQLIPEHFSQRTGAKELEFRDLLLSFAGDERPRLKAKSVRLTSEGLWNMRSGVLIDRGEAYEFEQATLNTAGRYAGNITLKSGTQSKTVNWFASAALPAAQTEMSIH